MSEDDLQRRILEAMRRITSAQEQEQTHNQMKPQRPPTKKSAAPLDHPE